MDERFVPYAENARHAPLVVLFNVSSPFGQILRARLRGHRVVLRVDGMYFDRLSPQFLETLGPVWSVLIIFGLKLFGKYFPAEDIANFINKNYGVIGKVVLAHHLIYQSEWCRKQYSRYFPNKRYDVIVNGAEQDLLSNEPLAAPPESAEIRLITIYNHWNPAKRLDALVEFVEWAQDNSVVPIKLCILGYTGTFPSAVASSLKTVIEQSSNIITYPPFKEIKGETARLLEEAHIFTTFTVNDACPNIVIEGMACGLPVVALASGGLPDIVGNSGILLSSGVDDTQHFRPARFEADFSPIDNNAVLDAVLEVHANLATYRERVRSQVTSVISMDAVSQRYRDVLLGYL